MPDLEGKITKPDTTEVKAILDLAHFVRYAEFKLLMSENIRTSWINDMDDSQTEEAEDEQTQPQATPLEQAPNRILGFRERFHHAVYHFLILGIVLTRAFQEPIYTRGVPLQNFLGMVLYALEEQEERHGERTTDLLVNQQEVTYLSEPFPS